MSSTRAPPFGAFVDGHAPAVEEDDLARRRDPGPSRRAPRRDRAPDDGSAPTRGLARRAGSPGRHRPRAGERRSVPPRRRARRSDPSVRTSRRCRGRFRSAWRNSSASTVAGRSAGNVDAHVRAPRRGRAHGKTSPSHAAAPRGSVGRRSAVSTPRPAREASSTFCTRCSSRDDSRSMISSARSCSSSSRASGAAGASRRRAESGRAACAARARRSRRSPRGGARWPPAASAPTPRPRDRRPAGGARASAAGSSTARRRTRASPPRRDRASRARPRPSRKRDVVSRAANSPSSDPAPGEASTKPSAVSTRQWSQGGSSTPRRRKRGRSSATATIAWKDVASESRSNVKAQA